MSRKIRKGDNGDEQNGDKYKRDHNSAYIMIPFDPVHEP